MRPAVSRIYFNKRGFSFPPSEKTLLTTYFSVEKPAGSRDGRAHKTGNFPRGWTLLIKSSLKAAGAG